MKDRFLDDFSFFEMLEDDPLQKIRCNSCIPHTFGIYDNDRTTSAHAKTRCFTPLHASRTEEKCLPLEERRELRIKSSSPAVRSAETASANDHVA